MTILNSPIGRGRLLSYAFMGVLIGVLIMGGVGNLITPPAPDPLITEFPSSLQRFVSYNQLKTFVEETVSDSSYYYPSWGWGTMRSPKGAQVLESAADAAVAAPGDYSTTNIQVEGVDEADLVKTDGLYIYIVSDYAVHIVRAYPPEEAELVSTITFDQMVQNIYVDDDKLIAMTMDDPWVYSTWSIPDEIWVETTKVHIYDISDRTAPALDRSINADGYTVNSRMIGDYVYLVTQRSDITYNEDEVWLPRFTDDGATTVVEADMIYYTNVTEPWYSFTNILAINVQDPDEQIGYESFLLGPSSTLYASRENIYLTSPSWDWMSESTNVYKITIDGRSIEFTADGTVPGRVLNQFSMDERDGYFRIAVTSGHVSRNGAVTSNDVYVLNASLGIVGSVTGLAPGEDIYSVRFMGDRCYMVTFKKVDPLFTIDIADPENPKVLGKLKIPGYSDYLHPYDENTLIGIGKESVEAEEGDFAWYQGVKISLFDVSDVENPRELAKIEIGDRGTDSPALDDHKAVLFSRERNLLVIPITVAEVDEDDYSGTPPDSAHGEYVYQGAYVFHVSREDGIEVTGRVTHIDDPETFLKSGYYFDSDLFVERSLYIEDNLYTISQGMVKVNALADLTEIASVPLP
ncbi:beta-propeller domain-containing protein [Candidatus Bathyarchaeota archaeon]|nr:beta-propeller domain-containing protein [Candidatus Bathyarchaeota archaeon]